MDNESKINFLRDFLKKCHVRSSLISIRDTADSILDPWISTIIGSHADPNVTVGMAVGSIEGNTRYRFINEFKLHYIIMVLPVLSEKNILFIGPYLSFPLTSKEILEISEEQGLPPNTEKALNEYYATLPIFSDGDRIFSFIDTFCEHIWDTPSFSVAEISKKHTLMLSPSEHISLGDGSGDVLADMEKMELRYSFENELISAVTLGQQHKEKMLFSAFNDQMFERRIQDPLRNAKNYCIIMNTLLRKAAEQGGVHPLYIDSVSSNLATRIELTADIKKTPELMRDMFSSYCRLVRKHSTKKYSSVVKKSILMIDADISAELSLSVLASTFGMSTGYLATVFKRETGKTVSEYIRDRRISHAVHLLNTTNLQVQTIAMHCGIMDVQYFSKVFKKQIGKTPKEYREAMRR